MSPEMRGRIYTILKVINQCAICETQCPLYEACEQCDKDICTMLQELDDELLND